MGADSQGKEGVLKRAQEGPKELVLEQAGLKLVGASVSPDTMGEPAAQGQARVHIWVVHLAWAVALARVAVL